ncbi:MAG: magnesium/cobalt transporter CorA [Candidatus Omnitrophota bacterium]
MYETFFYHPQKGLNTERFTVEAMRQALADPSCVLWVDFTEIDDEDIDLLTEVFNLHPLTVEDFIMANARPKVENFKEYLFLIMFSMECPDKETDRVRTSELDFCLGKNFLVTAHHEAMPPLAVGKERIKKQSPIIKQGTDFLLYSLLDCLVDSYFPVIDEFDSKVDEMSDELFHNPNNETLKKIYFLKNEIMYLRRTIGPQADAMNMLAWEDFPYISQANAVYFRNVFDNLVRLNDIVGTSRDIITGAMEAYVSIVSNKLNEVMKTLTIIATLVMPPMLIASFYGMNFKHMPELSSPYGYPAVIFVMGVSSVAMLWYFKRKKWF